MKKVLQSSIDKHKVSWLELFYDLIYVVIIAKLAHLVTFGHDGHLGIKEFLIFIALFIPVWWAWVGQALYATRFYDDSVVDRLLTLSQMFLVTLLALFISDAFNGEGQLFSLCYAGIRCLLVIMYLRVYFSNTEMRSVSMCLIRGFSFGAICWLISAFLATELMYTLWAIGLLIDFLTPLRCRQLLKHVSVHKHHLPERFGLLVIILLGESVVSLTSALTPGDLSIHLLLISLLGFISLSAVWWHYFEVIERIVVNRELGAAHLIIYGHLPVFIGLALFASAIRQNIVGSLSVEDVAWLFAIGLSCYLIPVLLIARQGQSKNEYRSLMRNTFILILLLFILAFVAKYLSSIAISFVVASLMVLYIFINTPKRKINFE